jgi:tRNA 5-methylaminomethyl-2-thiouridine biosynthesis bifunctional protein
LAIDLKDALIIEPQALLRAWLPQGCAPLEIHQLERRGDLWRLLDDQGLLVAEAEVVCLAGGPATSRLSPGLRLRPVRGQVSFSGSARFSGQAASWSGYAIPMRTGVLFGATHERDDWGEDRRAEDDRRNLQSLKDVRPDLEARIALSALESRASLRAMSPDYMPLAGPVADEPQLWVLSGLGGRGFALAPLLAEAVAAQALGAPSPLSASLRKIVDPRRFNGR